MSMIVFSPEIGFWSAFVFWFAVANTVATTLFTIVVIIGGAFDLRYLFRALESERVDETDDGRVIPADPAGRDHK